MRLVGDVDTPINPLAREGIFAKGNMANISATIPRVYLSLQVYQTLQHSSIQLMLLFLGFNQASHGGCNI